jgi:hypothetical protein
MGMNMNNKNKEKYLKNIKKHYSIDRTMKRKASTEKLKTS